MYFWGTVRVLALAVIMTAAVIDDLRRYKVSNKIIAYGLAKEELTDIYLEVLRGL